MLRMQIQEHFFCAQQLLYLGYSLLREKRLVMLYDIVHIYINKNFENKYSIMS